MFLSEPEHCWALLFAMGSGLRDEILMVREVDTFRLSGGTRFATSGKKETRLITAQIRGR